MKYRDLVRDIQAAGYIYKRTNGDHAIYKNSSGRHISVPRKTEVNQMLGQRLLKEIRK